MRELYKRYAERKGFMLNPDKKTADMLLDGMLAREKKYRRRYCPCRVVSGNREKDRNIICPCAYHLLEIEEMGRCWCGLFVKSIEVMVKKVFTPEEMEKWKEIRAKIDGKSNKSRATKELSQKSVTTSA